MTAQGYKFGHSTILGDPTADWSHAASYLAGLNADRLSTKASSEENDDEELRFRQSLMQVTGIDGLSEEDYRLANDLASEDGVDISYFPGGSNYDVSLTSDSNPLGLPGNLWAAVSDPEDGALVAALVRPTDDGGLEVKFPDGHDWETLDDPSVLSDFNYVGVNPEAVQLFRNYDRDNTLGVIGSYPISDDGPFPTEAQLEIPMPKEIPEPRTEDDEYWENSGETPGNRPLVSSVVVNGEDDLEMAIAAAADDPDLRWYVERRVAALGLEAVLPWQRG